MNCSSNDRIQKKIDRKFMHSVIDRICNDKPVLYFSPDQNVWKIRSDSGRFFICSSVEMALKIFAASGIRRIDMEFDGF